MSCADDILALIKKEVKPKEKELKGSLYWCGDEIVEGSTGKISKSFESFIEYFYFNSSF
jgi:hypothetical protein